MKVSTVPNHPNTPAITIPLQNGRSTIVDAHLFDELNRLHWYAKKSFSCWYALHKITIKGKVSFIRMHRRIANTPKDQVCHHINGNSLDNRVANLLNMTAYEHAKYFSYR